MMRKPHYSLFSSCATASSLTSNCIPYQHSGRIAAFAPSSSTRANAHKACSRNSNARRTTGRESFPSTHRTEARRFGSTPVDFRRTFLGTTAKGRAGDDYHGKYPVGRGDDDDDDDDYQPSNDVIKSRSMDWIERVVVGLNFCPFAERPLKEDRLKISVVRGDDDEHVAAAVAYELISRSVPSRPGTTIVVAPEYHPDDFEKFMSLVQFIEDDVAEVHLRGLVQVAPFHPAFEFAGSGKEGVDNYTNRSPYPMFHILREDEVEAAVNKLGGDASKVWSRNVELLEAMEKLWGKSGVEMAMRGEDMDGIDDLLKEVRLSGQDVNGHDR